MSSFWCCCAGGQATLARGVDAKKNDYAVELSYPVQMLNLEPRCEKSHATRTHEGPLLLPSPFALPHVLQDTLYEEYFLHIHCVLRMNNTPGNIRRTHLIETRLTSSACLKKTVLFSDAKAPGRKNAPCSRRRLSLIDVFRRTHINE